MGDIPGNKQICRLCLNIVSAAHAEAIREKEKTILEVLLINVDLHVTENAVACSRCMEELRNGFEFKSACLHVDNCISTIVDANVPVDMKEVFRGEMRDTAMASVDLGNRQICQLCSSLISDEALDCNTGLKDIIANCLPEVDIRTVHEPLVCGLCFSRVKKLNEFMKTCQEVERTINNYCQATADHAIPVSVSLDDLLKFKNSTISKLIKEECSTFDSNELKNVKKEDTFSIECEEIHIKSEHESGDEMGDFVPSGACKNSENMNSLKGHMAKHPRAEKEFKCDKCPYETNFKGNLCKHNRIHMDKSEVEMYKCDNCEFETKYKRNMKQHMVKHRDPKTEKEFKCDKCPYETHYKTHLRRHNLQIHMDKSEVEIHKCEICEFETRYKASMIDHMRKHRNPQAGKKFKCDKCPYETDFKGNLSKHNRIHKDKSEVEMHKCERCEYETMYKSCMVRHMVKHRDLRGE